MQQDVKHGIWIVVGIVFMMFFFSFVIPALFMLGDAGLRWLQAVLKV